MASLDTSRGSRTGFKLVTRTYTCLREIEAGEPYRPGKTRRLTDDEIPRFKIRRGPGLHFCDSAVDCLPYVVDVELQLGESILDCYSCGRNIVPLRLLRVSVPEDDDSSAVQRIVGAYGRKCAATVLRVDSEVTDPAEMATLFHGAHSILHVYSDAVMEWRFVNGRYVLYTETDTAGNILTYKTPTVTTNGAYVVVARHGRLAFRFPNDALEFAKENVLEVEYRQSDVLVKTYTVDGLRAAVHDGAQRFAAMMQEQNTVLHE